jgi:hypothetical protein
MHDVLDRWTVVVITTRVRSVRRALCTRWARIGESGSAYYKQSAWQVSEGFIRIPVLRDKSLRMLERPQLIK